MVAGIVFRILCMRLLIQTLQKTLILWHALAQLVRFEEVVVITSFQLLLEEGKEGGEGEEREEREEGGRGREGRRGGY